MVEVLLRSLYGAAAVMAVGPTRGGPAEVFNMFKVSAVPPRRSAVLTVIRDATAINEGTTAAPRRSWRRHCGLCRTNTAMAPHLRCDGGRRSEPLRNHGDHGDATAVTAVQAPQWHRTSGVTGV